MTEAEEDDFEYGGNADKVIRNARPEAAVRGGCAPSHAKLWVLDAHFRL